MTLADVLPTVNAALNAASAVLLFAGWRAIRAGRRDVHRALMLSAFGSSTLFLASYLTRVALTGTHRFPGSGLLRAAYLAVLASHTLLAVAALPLVLRTLFLALRERLPEHRRIARWTLPIWLYVSVTGVVVYVMLYHLAHRTR
jgi:putative membrane protein